LGEQQKTAHISITNEWWTERELNPRPPECKSSWVEETAFRLSSYNSDKLLEHFREFLLVDLRRSNKTTYEAVRIVGNFLDSLDSSEVSRTIVRRYLKPIKSESVYRNTLAAFKRFFRDFLDRPEIVATFKFPQSQFKPKVVPSKEELQRFYDALDSELSEALFLFYASSGLRKNEVLSLTLKNVDFEKRMIVPNCHWGSTKSSYVSFYNEETEQALKRMELGEISCSM
jgi:integrase